MIGLICMRDAYDRLHYVSLPSFGALLIAVAIVVSQSFSLIGDKALATACVLVVFGPVLVHATARSLRVRERGDWRAGADDRVRGRVVTVLQAVALILVAVTGTAVVLAPELLRQAIVLGIYGLVLTLLFFVFQAPDVALSEIVVQPSGCRVIVLAALRKIRAADSVSDDEGPDA